MNKALLQFTACLQSYFEVQELNSSFFENSNAAIQEWYTEFQSDIYESKFGYSKGKIRRSPDLEDKLFEIIDTNANTKNWHSRDTKPTLCLTHDIDYLKPTVQMKFKNLISAGGLKANSADYLSSIKTLLQTDSELAGKKATSTVFIASRCKARTIKKRMTQWLIDPSYRLDDELFHSLLNLLKEYDCEIGLHGSFYSIEEDLLEKEKQQINAKLRPLGKSIRVGRQHWLNLPSGRPFETIWNSGIHIDSTLGWNGDYGFRGGLSRPFPLLLDNEKTLWEVPLVLMDGPLFQDLKLSSEQVFEQATKMLELVYQRKGCVALDWHDRAATPEYGWIDSYAKILKWAKARGFEFSTISEAVPGVAKETLV